MIRSFLLLLFVGGFITGNAQLNMDLVSHTNFVSEGKGNGNDIWGYVAPDGTEYAIVGTTKGTLIYSLEDPAAPIERTFIQGSNSTWRDMKQWGEYVYVTTDSGNDGLLVINMEGAPDSIEFVFRNTKVHVPNITDSLEIGRCHNIYIDEAGIIYLAGCQGTRGVDFLDPNIDPWDPPYIGGIFSPYHHDVYVKDDLLHGSRIYNGDLALYDVSDKSNPVLLGSHITSSDFTHNAWGDPNNNYSFTTDEQPEGFVDAYDISDPENIQFLDKFMPPGKAGTGTIPHNTHYFNGYLVTSWYTSGVVIIDGNKPDNLVQVAEYDTYDGPDGGFSGCWGVTPFLPSGILLVNDINSGFYVFNANYSRACYLEGTVTDINTGEVVNGVTVEIIGGDYSDEVMSEAMGIYKTGQPSEGLFTVVYSHPLYDSKTFEVNLSKGNVTIQDVQLGSLPTFDFNVSITDETTGLPIENAKVVLESQVTQYEYDTDASGNLTAEVIQDEYNISIGIWGYENIQITNKEIVASESISIELAPGYMDDFILDQGWTIENIEEPGEDFSGAWERVIPAGTFDDNGKQYAPSSDAINDIGQYAYVTENAIGGTSFSNDVDDGTTTLISPPMDLTTYVNPGLEFSLWFQTGGGNSTPDDQIDIIISNGTTEVLLFSFSDPASSWTELFNLEIASAIEISNNMTLKVQVSDFNSNGHIVEAGFDDFQVTEIPVNNKNIELEKCEIYPSPASEFIKISHKNTIMEKIEIVNQLGQTLISKEIESLEAIINTSNLINGIYFVNIYFSNENSIIQQVQIIR